MRGFTSKSGYGARRAMSAGSGAAASARAGGRAGAGRRYASANVRWKE